MKKIIIAVFTLLPFMISAQQVSKDLAKRIKSDKGFSQVSQKALDVIKSGFNAGSGYREVWIRDYNTFIELASKVYPKEELKENLLVFFRMQGEDGNIIDGFTPRAQIGAGETDFTYSDLEPRYAGHKNTVETDQETSLIQTVAKYIKFTNDRSILTETIGGRTVAQRMEDAIDFLFKHRYSKKYGLITGATTADWGDVQPEHGLGVDIDDNTHFAIDIYDNAMLLIALQDMMAMLPQTKNKWQPVHNAILKNSRKYLWDQKNQKFKPHVYLNGSPFPKDFDEDQIYYFGGTAIAIEAGLLNKKEIKNSIEEMKKRVKQAGAPSIGLTLYPPYPKGFFINKILTNEYTYQNGGDWTWFGGRMIQQLIKNGFVQEAYEEVQPMIKRVIDNKGFFEWYSIDNKPSGSGTFKGEAGVLYTAIEMFKNWAAKQK